MLYVPVTKLKLAANPVLDAVAGEGGLRDVRVICNLPDGPLINMGGSES